MDSLSDCVSEEISAADEEMFADMQKLNLGFQAEEMVHAIARFHQNADRARYQKDLMIITNDFPKKEHLQGKKTEARAAKARIKGNDCYTASKFEEALKYYNKSLCFSPVGSDSLAIGYANRSAIYLRAGFFQFCLENIDLALEHGYPERLKPKLWQRKDECLARMKKEKDSYELYGKLPTIPLSHPANPKIPFAINALKLEKNEKYGRHIITTRDLKAGDIICTEQCIVTTLNESDTYSQCLNCCEQNFYNLKPCPKATTVMFCSDKCAQEAWNRFYKYEHVVIDGIYEAVESIHNVFAIRSTIRAFTMLENVSELKKLVDSIDDEGETAFDLDLSQNDEVTKFRAFYSLLPVDQYKPNTADLFKLSRTVALSWYILKEFTDMKSLLKKKDHEDLFLELLFRFAAISRKTSISLSNPHSPVEPNHLDSTRIKSFGIGINVVDGLLNHSCFPNVGHLPGRHALVVQHPIKKGEQLFDTYGPRHISMKKIDRQLHLLETYRFECDCVACVHDYPDTNGMRLKGILPLGIIKAATELTGKKDLSDKKWKQKATTMIDTINKFMMRNMQHYPCLDIGVCGETLDNCLQVLYCHKPLKFILDPKN